MSIVLFREIQSIIVEIQTCESHTNRPVVIGMFDDQYHVALSNKKHRDNISRARDINIDSEYFISSISFKSSQSKFRFAVKRTNDDSDFSHCFICGFKIASHRKTVLDEWRWYKTIVCNLATDHKCIIPILFGIGFCAKLSRYGLLLSVNGISLDQIIKTSNNSFNIETSMYILYKSIDCISYLHEIDIIHCDIKYANLTLLNTSNIGIIDFDCTTFYNKTCEDISNLDTTAFYPLRGTPLFASIDAHHRKLLSKRSDLISLLFSVIYGHNTKLLMWNKKDDVIEIQEKKAKYVGNIQKYLQNTRLPQQFIRVFNYINKLQYHETPNYKYMKNIIASWLKTIDMKSIQWDPKQMTFLNELKRECFKEYQLNKLQVNSH